jgi:hypothetical protein
MLYTTKCVRKLTYVFNRKEIRYKCVYLLFFRGLFRVYVNLILIWICITNAVTLWQHVFMAPRPLVRRGLLIVEWSARRSLLYLTTHNAHNRQTSMPPSGFDPPILASECQQTNALTSAATWIGVCTALPEAVSPNHREKFKKTSMSIVFTFHVLL